MVGCGEVCAGGVGLFLSYALFGDVFCEEFFYEDGG